MRYGVQHVDKKNADCTTLIINFFYRVTHSYISHCLFLMKSMLSHKSFKHFSRMNAF